MTETWAHLSNNAVYSATIIFVLALIAHIVEWAASREVETVAAPAVAARPLVAAGAGAGGSGSLGAAGGSGLMTQGTAPSDDEEAIERGDRYGRMGFALTVLGCLVLAAGVAFRGVAADRVPWGNMYEFATTGCVAVCVAYIVLVRRYGVRWLGLPITAFVVTVLGLAVMVLYRPITPLVPALHSYWLMIHVSAAAVAGGAYTVGALASVLFLMRRRAEQRAARDPEHPRTGFLWRMPSAEAIDRTAYRVHAFAFPMWTFAVMCGAIWAQYAWGRFWGWDPKEVWAFITWVAYAAYLHARATAGWQGRAAAYVALLGYATFLFNFIGINLFGSGLHSYSGM